MQPQDANSQVPDIDQMPNSQTQFPAVPDLPDAALPTIEPVQSDNTLTSSQPAHQPFIPTPDSPSVQLTENKNNDQGRSRLTKVGKKYFKLIEFDEEEQLLAEIRKHPFGLFIIVITGIVISFALFLGIAVLAASSLFATLGLGNINSIVAFIGFLLSLIVMAITFINAYLYRNNVVFVTNEKLAQVLFITLFNRKISQLSIGDVQDVTVQQKGFLPNVIGYGTLVVETAGEQQNYTFTFVPKPYETSKVIINAHESNLKQYGN